MAKRFCKENPDLNFYDLNTIIRNRDSKHQGKLDFNDFCKWMGSSIEPNEGYYYFRHNPFANIEYEQSSLKDSKTNGEFRKKVSDKITQSNLIIQILEKISTQWKTIKKAFSDLSQERNGWICESDLNRYLKNWGFVITSDQFKEIYDFLDYDHDGHISYTDFKNRVGSTISPVESLYFRQDLPHK